MANDKLKRLRKMLEQVDVGSISSRTEGETLENAFGGGEGSDQLEAVSAGSLAEHEMAFAQESLDLFVEGREIDSEQQFALEAIILPFKRPVVDILKNQMNPSQLTGEWKSLATSAHEKMVIENALMSIGRIEVPNNLQLPYAGTGFVVGPNLLMTNRHVASIFALGLGATNLTFIPGQNSQVDFIQELGNPDTESLEIVDIKMIHPYWDMALLEVKGLPATRPPLCLSTADPSKTIGAKVVTIGYPGYDPKPDREFQRVQSRVFRDVYYVKRLQPGLLKAHEEVKSFMRPVHAITHDCSTLGGNSGSAVIDLKTGHVVGLHFAGAYLHANYAVPTIELSADRRVVDAGVQFAGDSRPATDPYEDLWQKAESELVPAPQKDSACDSVHSQSSAQTNSPPLGARSPTDYAATWTLPLMVTVDLGDVQRATAVTAPPPDLSSQVVPHASAAPTNGCRQLEKLFGPPVKEHSLTDLAEMFSADSLAGTGFEMAVGLSSAAASKFAYENGAVIEPFGVGGFGFKTCKFIVADDTQCFIASTKKVVVIAFRGTQSFGDWMLNIRVLSTGRPYGQVHTGFLRGFEFVQMQLEAELAKFPEHTLLLTGHSLGGALATIAAAEWAERFKIAAVYTFGQPAVGKGNFASHMDRHYSKKFFRFVNNSDAVAKVPPTYAHVGRLLHFDKHGNFIAAAESTHENTSSMMSDEEFARLQESLQDLRSANRTQGAATESVFTAFSDHRMDKYIGKITKQIDKPKA